MHKKSQGGVLNYVALLKWRSLLERAIASSASNVLQTGATATPDLAAASA